LLVFHLHQPAHQVVAGIHRRVVQRERAAERRRRGGRSTTSSPPPPSPVRASTSSGLYHSTLPQSASKYARFACWRDSTGLLCCLCVPLATRLAFHI
jgi:hypothetical protein